VSAAPAWLVVAAATKGNAKPFEGAVSEWLETQPTGQISRAVQTVADSIPTGEFDHNEMIRLQSKLVGLASDGLTGVGWALDRLRSEYLRGEYDQPKYRDAYDTALAKRIRTHGAPNTRVTLPLTKKERKAKKRKAVAPVEPATAAPGYVDVAGILAGDMTPPKPDAGAMRADGALTLYRGKVNGLVGESEAGKTLIATAMVADELRRGGSALWVDVDHNGAPATLGRLIAAGVLVDVLTDASRFRLVVPEDRASVAAAVADAGTWQPTIAVVDSVGEIVPMFGGDSNSSDDFTRVHREVFVPLARAGAAVLAIDHLAKTALGTGYASGTGAKKRAVDGAYYGVKLVESFRPGVGGAAALTILKDRHGGVRATTPGETAAVFRLDSRVDEWSWEFHVGRSDDERAAAGAEADIATVLALDPFPTSRTALQSALRDINGKGWNNERAHAALTQAAARRASTFPIDPARPTTPTSER
jgi:hypothetical protein